MTTHQVSQCRHLAWDSDFFGKRIARLSDGRLDAESAAAALAWCETERIDCLYFLADADDPQTTMTAESNGFHLVDIRLTLERHLTDVPQRPVTHGVTIRGAGLDDLPALEAIARVSFRQSRFYYDGHFSPARCDDLYAAWIGNAVRGDAQITHIAVMDGQPVGFTSCHLHQNAGQIGLVGVKTGHQGLGIGGALLNAALIWFANAGAGTVSVVTQGRNIGAQRIYQKHGFTTTSVALWYHRWFVDRA